RPAVDLDGSAGSCPAAGRAERGRPLRERVARHADRFPRAELSLGGPRRRAGPAQGRGAAEGACRREREVAGRGLSRGRVGGRTRLAAVHARTLDRAAAWPLPSEVDGARGLRAVTAVTHSVV